MPKILILGSGQIGTFAAHAIAQEGVFVIAGDNKPDSAYFNRFGPKKEAILLTVDILDCAAVESIIKSFAVDTIVLSVGLTGENYSHDMQKAWEVNVRGTEAVSQVALNTGIKRLVYLSSLAVYGQPNVDRITETTPIIPQTMYGRIKLEAEKVLAIFRDKGLDVRILRSSGVYGPLGIGKGSRSARLIDILLFHAITKQKLSIKASNLFADEYLYVKDLGRAVALAALYEPSLPEFVFNVGPGRKMTIYELYLALQKVIPDAPFVIEVVDSEDIFSYKAPLDIQRIRNAFGFEPQYSLLEGIADYYRGASF